MARRISGDGRVTVSLRRSIAAVLAGCFSGSGMVCVAETGFIADSLYNVDALSRGRLKIGKTRKHCRFAGSATELV
jgi:hypothetical protein